MEHWIDRHINRYVAQVIEVEYFQCTPFFSLVAGLRDEANLTCTFYSGKFWIPIYTQSRRLGLDTVNVFLI